MELTHDDIASVYGAACADRANGYGEGALPATSRALRELLSWMGTFELAPAEALALKVATGIAKRGEEVDANTTTVLIIALERAQRTLALSQITTGAAAVTDEDVRRVYDAAGSDHASHTAENKHTRAALQEMLDLRAGEKLAAATSATGDLLTPGERAFVELPGKPTLGVVNSLVEIIDRLAPRPEAPAAKVRTAAELRNELRGYSTQSAFLNLVDELVALAEKAEADRG